MAREPRVPPISLVFREMWDTTTLSLQLWSLLHPGTDSPTSISLPQARVTTSIKNLNGPRAPGAPHLARVSRDVGYHDPILATLEFASSRYGQPHLNQPAPSACD